MSRNSNSKNSKISTPSRKFCKVCQDAGKSEAEYTSHYTRELPDPKSKVVCPTLLALECRYCYKAGHTVKYCSILKEKERETLRAEKQKAEKPQKVLPAPGKLQGKISNKFQLLDSDSDDEEGSKVYQAKYPTQMINSVSKMSHKEEQVQAEVEEYPALCATKLPQAQASISNYASALAKPAPVRTSVVVPLPQITSEKANVKVAPWVPSGKKASEMNWAEWDSSSDEEEEMGNQEAEYDSDW